MTIYLKHRLEKAGITHLESACIYQPDDRWMFKDIAAELRSLFPAASIRSSRSAAPVTCQLALIPYVQRGYTHQQRTTAVREVLPFAPDWIGFYELGRRRLVIVRRQRLFLYYARTALEQALRFAGRLALAAAGKVVGIRRRRLEDT